MKLIRIVFSLIFANIFILAHSQQIEIRGGLNLSKTLYFIGDTSVYSNRLLGLNAGIRCEFKLAENLYQSVGVSFSQRGYKIAGTGNQLKYRFNYIDIPANVKYKFDLEDLFLVFEVGPYVAIGLNGRVTYGGKNQRIHFGNNEDQVKRFDAGINIGYSLEFDKLVISSYYFVGFINISNNNTESLKNRVFCFSLGYLIK